MKRRNTKSKTAILTALKSVNCALNHEMLQDMISPNIDRATIYRVLNRFCEDGKIHKVIGDDGKQYFALCHNCSINEKTHSHNHFHFRCLACGKVECLNNEIEVSLPLGYTFENFNGFITGLCNSCS